MTEPDSPWDGLWEPHPSTSGLLLARREGLARIRLNRPSVINALTTDMVLAMLDQLRSWADDPTVETVVLDGAGGRGLCAGGDVRALRDAVLAGDREAVLVFWAREYELDATIAAYPKPFVALMDGITMGGGLGLSAHARVRLVTPGSRLAMPETAIGFFPDVAMMHPLGRAPGELGTHLALTGASFAAADAVYLGLADRVVDGPASVDAAPDAVASGRMPPPGPVEPPALPEARSWVDDCYRGDDASDILDRLHEHPAGAARQAGAVLASRSPLSVAVTLAALRRARTLTLTEVFEQDLRLGRAFLDSSDFVEGVRAVLVDKDHAPRWRHASLSDVDPSEVAAAIAGPS